MPYNLWRVAVQAMDILFSVIRWGLRETYNLVSSLLGIKIELEKGRPPKECFYAVLIERRERKTLSSCGNV